jgi:hypothetical protein
MENGETLAIDNRFFTTKEVEIFDDTELFLPLRKIPAGTLLPYDRKVIRHNRRIAQAIEQNGNYSYFSYSGSTRSCEHCVVGEEGLDVLNVHPDRLTGADITVQKKAFTESGKTLEKSEIITDGGFTHLMLKDKSEKKEAFLHVTIKGSIYYDLIHLEPGTEFFILSDTSASKGKSIILFDGSQAVLFHKEGMYKTVEEGWAKAYKALAIIVGLAILFGGIFGIAASTGYIVVIGIIMIPVTFILTAIVVAPIVWTIELIRRFF